MDDHKRVKSLVCRGSRFLLTWEPAIQKLLARRVTCLMNDCEPNASFSLGNELELHITYSPPFAINEISLNSTETVLLCSGNDGVIVVNLPGDMELILSQTRSQESYCKSYILDPAHFSSLPAIRQASWLVGYSHGALTSDISESLLIATLSIDNCLRIYNAACSSSCLSCVNFSQYTENRVFSDILGDNIISFSSVKLDDKDGISLLCISRNGDVYLVDAISHNRHISPKVSGPITMLPEAEDNYGDSFEGIAVLDMSPPGVVMVDSSGGLMHCLLLPGDDKDVQPTLYVVERIPFDDSDQEEQITNDTTGGHFNEMFIYANMIEPKNYYTWNRMGAYYICADALSSLNSGTNNYSLTESNVRHLLSTHFKSTYDPLIGVVHFPECNALFCTSDSLSTYLISLGPKEKSLDFNHRPLPSASESLQPFLPYIQKLLKESKKPPRLSLGSAQGSPDELCQAALTSISSLREQRLDLLTTISAQIQKRRALVHQQVKFQQTEIQRLKKLKDTLIDQAREVAEKLETLNSNQEVIESTVENLNLIVNSQVGLKPDSEVHFANELENIQRTLSKKRSLISSLKNSDLSKSFPESDSSVVSLDRSSLLRSGMVQKLVNQESSLINDLISQVNGLKLGMNTS